MTQDELNVELDFLLEELIFNQDIDASTSPFDMKRILLARCQLIVTEEQWQAYALYCLISTAEGDTPIKKVKERIQ